MTYCLQGDHVHRVVLPIRDVSNFWHQMSHLCLRYTFTSTSIQLAMAEKARTGCDRHGIPFPSYEEEFRIFEQVFVQMTNMGTETVFWSCCHSRAAWHPALLQHLEEQESCCVHATSRGLMGQACHDFWPIDEDQREMKQGSAHAACLFDCAGPDNDWSA